MIKYGEFSIKSLEFTPQSLEYLKIKHDLDTLLGVFDILVGKADTDHNNKIWLAKKLSSLRKHYTGSLDINVPENLHKLFMEEVPQKYIQFLLDNSFIKEAAENLVKFLDEVFKKFQQVLCGNQISEGRAWLDKDLIARVLHGVEVMTTTQGFEYNMNQKEFDTWMGFAGQVREKLTNISRI